MRLHNTFNVSDLFSKIQWNELQRETGKILLVDVTDLRFPVKEITDEFTHNQLLEVDSIILNNFHEVTALGSITHYKILERTIVTNNHLIIFGEPKSHQIQLT